MHSGMCGVVVTAATAADTHCPLPPLARSWRRPMEGEELEVRYYY